MGFMMSAGECAAAIEGRLIAGPEDTVFTSVSIDTRTMQQGALFFAIPGPRFDGHDFVGRSLQQGAGGAVISRSIQSPDHGVLIEVPDTAQALLRLAAHHRRRWGRRLVCITGSAGKTTTKEILARLLQTKYAVYKSPGNFNNIFGLSQSLLSLDEAHELAVVEIGMSAPGEIAMLASAAAPDLGLLTNVAAVHLEFFPSVDAIAEAKGELLSALKENGTLVYNFDDERIAALSARHIGNKVSFGFNRGADLSAETVELMGLEGCRFVLRHGATSRQVQLTLPGRHNVSNFLAAAAAAMAWGLSLDDFALAAAGMRTEAHRGAVMHFQEGFAVVDDSYNSNPSAMNCMLELMRETTGYTRKILVAGEMLELGAESVQCHLNVGRTAAQSGIDLLIGVRGQALSICHGAIEAGLDPERVQFCEDAAAAGEALFSRLRKGDLALVKGSHGVCLESLVAELCRRFVKLPDVRAGNGKH